ncbi:MAG TPA: GlxA family transcriptional regulator [Steroidobacteraceae bacterium]|nr:GlxA family transcriptional regulator [Steroidobacteraceae bacterium]
MRKLAFVLLPEFSHLGIAASIEPLFIANWLAQEALFEWKLVSLDGKPVRASNRMMIPVDGDLAAAESAKTVFVLASFEPAHSSRELQRWLKRRARFGTELVGIENGSFVLAEAGLLDGHGVAVHWDNLLGFREHYPRTRPLSHLYARSADRISCAGASAILDLMVAWIGWRGESGLAAEVAEHLLLGRLRSPDTEQRAPDANPGPEEDGAVTRAEALMREHVDEPLSCGEIARRVGLSLRQMERRFRQSMQCSVLERYRLIRMTKAHQLLQQTALSVTDVAFSCGFSSPEYFCRLYRVMFDCSPSKDRRQSTTAPVLRQRPRPRAGRPRRAADPSQRTR